VSGPWGRRAGRPALRRATALVALALCPTLTAAQEPVAGAVAAAGAPAIAEPLSLAAAIERARTANPALVAARSRAAAAAAESTATRRGRNWPRLAASSGWTATDQPAAVFAQRLDAGVVQSEDFAVDRLTDPDVRSHLATSVGVELPLDLFGKAAPAIAGAEAGARAAAAGAREAELAVVQQVTAAWYGALVAERAVIATERTVAGSAAREAELLAQTEEGAALRADLLRVRARRRNLEAQLASRRGERQTALAALALAIGATTPVVPAGEAVAPPPPRDLAEWLAGANDRPAVAAAQAVAESAAERARAELRSDRPDLLLTTLLRDDRGPLDEGQISGMGGVFVRWSFYDPQRAPRRVAAESASSAAAAEVEAARARARYEIEAAWHGAAAAHERWLAARGGTEEGQEALRVVRERRQAGLATLTDELETEASALLAELDELSAAAAAAEALAALERAAGITSPRETAP
jgi:outer membrane protein TolC